jgi:glycosyltransferase involved in cell wall biosynthesis
VAGALHGQRIAVVCHGTPHPTEGASVVLYWHYLAGLLDHGASVELCLIGDPPADGGAWSDALAARGPIRLAGFASARPVRHDLRGLHVDRALADRLASHVAACRATMVLCFDWVAAACCVQAGPPRVVWLGDLQFDTLLHHTRYAFREGSRRYDRLLLLGYRVRQLRRFYVRILAGAAGVVVSSASSVAALSRLGVASCYLPYPWPAAGDAVRAPPPRGAPPRYLFSGTLGALGSRAAFHMMVERLLPQLAGLEAEVLITGRGAVPGWAAPSLAAHPRVRMLGFVEDLGALMATATGFIAPIDVPVGNRSRVLTAMAAGLPIVAHPNTALGNPLLRDRETCHLAADPVDFARRMIALHEDPAAAAAMAARALAAWRAHHAPPAANATLANWLAAQAARAA